MKEMVYQTIKITEILSEGEYCGYHFVIVSYGTHPCAYVEIPKDHPSYMKDYDDIDIDVHGGITYGRHLSHVLGERGLDGFYIGWDYAHAGDFTGDYLDGDYRFGKHEKKWTTEEIFEDVKSVIHQLEEQL